MPSDLVVVAGGTSCFTTVVDWTLGFVVVGVEAFGFGIGCWLEGVAFWIDFVAVVVVVVAVVAVVAVFAAVAVTAAAVDWTNWMAFRIDFAAASTN